MGGEALSLVKYIIAGAMVITYACARLQLARKL